MLFPDEVSTHGQKLLELLLAAKCVPRTFDNGDLNRGPRRLVGVGVSHRDQLVVRAVQEKDGH